MHRRNDDRRQATGTARRASRYDIDGQYGSISNIGGDQHIYHGDDAYHLEQFRRSGPVVKALVVAGFLACLAGLALFGYTLFSHNPSPGDPDFASMPDGIALAAATFFGGFVLVAVGSVAMALGGPRER